MTGQRSTRDGAFVPVIVLFLLLGIATGGLALVRGDADLWRIADLFFDVSLLVTMIGRGGALLRG
jgi:hypothetical protein